MVYNELRFGGTAWLSSVRVVKCNIKLLNERNLCYEYTFYFLLKVRVGVLILTLAADRFRGSSAA